MERNNDGWKLYTFGMNDEDGRLIEIKMPARNYQEAVHRTKRIVNAKCAFWLNSEEEYR